MKKILSSILILSVLFSSGCLGNRKSALEKFKEQNPIEKMLFSKKSKSNKKNPTNKKIKPNTFSNKLVNLNDLKNIPDHPINWKIKV